MDARSSSSPISCDPHYLFQKSNSGASSVPVHRTLNQDQPLVFPSSFDASDTQVRPVEPLYASGYGGPQIPYGPRALHVGADGRPIINRKRRAADILSRTERSADIGVQSGYEVVSEVDLDFTPDEVDRTVATFQVIMRRKIFSYKTNSLEARRWYVDADKQLFFS